MDTLEAALRGGVDLVQVRAKEATSRELLALAREVKRAVGGRALVIVNDRTDIAIMAEADGVHLGQEDLPVAEARKILGPDRLIGVSTHSLGQAIEAQKSGADYLGFGPIFPSSTKGYPFGLGEKAFLPIRRKAKVPVFLIGGIGPENLSRIPGAERIAVSSAVLSARDPAAVVRRLRAILSKKTA